MKALRIIFFIILLSIAGAVSSANELVFGPEFTFTTDQGDWKAFNYIDKYVDYLEEELVLKRSEKASFSQGGTTFVSPNGWSFIATPDSGVLEVQMEPLTLDEYKKFKSEMQDSIFESAYEIGLTPFEYLGGGHINIGLEYFEDKPLLLRNFLVDTINHNELSMGILNYDTNNALPFWLQGDFQYHGVKKVLKKFDKGFYHGEDNFRFLEDFHRATYEGAFDKFFKLWGKSNRGKNHALNLEKFEKKYKERRRIEIRSVRPQQSMDVFVRQIELFSARIAYLKKLNKPIPLKKKVKILSYNNEKDVKLTPPINPQQAIGAFYKYVTESGLSWEDHKDYIWPWWIQNGEIERFDKSLECRRLLVRGGVSEKIDI